MKMPWGKYEGADVASLPDSYLFWLFFSAKHNNEKLRLEVHSIIFNRFPDKIQPMRNNAHSKYKLVN